MKPTTSFDIWEKSETAAQKALNRLAKKTGNELIEYSVREDDEEENLERMTKKNMLRKVFEQAIRCYEDGDYTYRKTLDELCDAFEAMK